MNVKSSTFRPRAGVVDLDAVLGKGKRGGWRSRSMTARNLIARSVEAAGHGKVEWVSAQRHKPKSLRYMKVVLIKYKDGR